MIGFAAGWRCIRFAAVALYFCVSLWAPQCSAEELGSDGNPLNGMAPVYFALPAGPWKVSAELSLPEKPLNKGWYANWVMLVDRPISGGHEEFAQIGLIRTRNGFRLFGAFQRRAEAKISYVDLGEAPSSSGFLTFSIARSGRNVLCYYGDKEMMVVGDVFDLRSKIYAQVGPEVYSEGDVLSGDVRNVTLADGSTVIAVVGPKVCRYDNHGLWLEPVGDGFRAMGTFARRERSRFLGDCSPLY